MPGARFSFSCDVQSDLDVIQFLNEYSTRERGLIIKKAIREFNKSQEGSRLEIIEDKLAQLLVAVVRLRQSGAIVEIEEQLEVTETIVADTDLESIKDNIRAMLGDVS